MQPQSPLSPPNPSSENSSRPKSRPKGFAPWAFKMMKQNFLAGLLVMIPFGIILWMLSWLFNFLWSLRETLPEMLQLETWVGSTDFLLPVQIAGMLLFLLTSALLISVLGWISKQVLGIQILKALSQLIQRIPVIRGVYSALDQLLKTFSASGPQQFSRVVYVEYPRKDSWTLAFVTGPGNLPGSKEAMLSLYVPTTPNPTSGFFIIVPESQIRESHLTVEEAFKTILSLGIAQSGPKKSEASDSSLSERKGRQ